MSTSIQSIIDHEFNLDPSLCYLNHAAVAPWPKRTAEAVTKFAHENTFKGATSYPEWLKIEQQLRINLAKLIGTETPLDIALAKNTSEALSIIAYGLPWQEKDEVIISNQEFPSNRIVWESLASKGVKVVTANIDQDPVHEAILNQVTNKTRLVSISSVQYATGKITDLIALSQALKKKNILLCVDAIQSLGAYQFDQKTIDADFIVADGHKWMLGPEGIALLYVKPVLREQLQLLQYGWHMVQNRGDYNRMEWQPAADATRFECGSPNMLGIHALNASLSLLNEIGMAEIEKRLINTTDALIDLLQHIPDIRFHSDTTKTHRSAIITFSIDGCESATLQRHLMNNGVICAHRGGGIRFSPHFYTHHDVLRESCNKIRYCLSL